MSDGFEPYGDPMPHGRIGEDAVGLRISIFCSEGFDPSLEGIITSYDHETGKHGILFDTGVQLDIDISKERVMLEQPPLKESLADDNSSDVVPIRSERHHFPKELYRHSLELRAEQQQQIMMMERNSRHTRQGSFGDGVPIGGRSRGVSTSSNPERRDSNNRGGGMSMQYNSMSGDASPEFYADTESNWSRSSLAERRRREEIIGLRITIFHTDSNKSLEGMVISYDDSTRCHGILFDSGVELDIDIHEERIKLSRNREKTPTISPSPSQLPMSEIEEEKTQTTAALRQWIMAHTKDITLQAACKYAATLYHYNIPSINKLAKKLVKDPSFLQQIGFDEDDLEEVMQALRVEHPNVPAYTHTLHAFLPNSSSSLSSSLLLPSSSSKHQSTSNPSDTNLLRQFAAKRNGPTTLQHLFQALNEHKVDDDQKLASAVAALTGADPIPTGSV